MRIHYMIYIHGYVDRAWQPAINPPSDPILPLGPSNWRKSLVALDPWEETGSSMAFPMKIGGLWDSEENFSPQLLLAKTRMNLPKKKNMVDDRAINFLSISKQSPQLPLRSRSTAYEQYNVYIYIHIHIYIYIYIVCYIVQALTSGFFWRLKKSAQSLSPYPYILEATCWLRQRHGMRCGAMENPWRTSVPSQWLVVAMGGSWHCYNPHYSKIACFWWYNQMFWTNVAKL